MIVTINPQQLSAARALLEWNGEALSDHANVGLTSIRNFERGQSSLSSETQEKIVRAVDLAGVEFIDGGVRFKPEKITTLDSEDWFSDLLDDVYYTLLDKDNAELLIEYSDDALSPPEVIGRYRKIRNAGIKMRQIVREGNTYLNGPVSEYRWVEPQFFKNYFRLIYGSKMCIDMGKTGLLINEKIVADTARNDFDLKWSLLPELDIESTADVRF